MQLIKTEWKWWGSDKDILLDNLINSRNGALNANVDNVARYVMTNVLIAFMHERKIQSAKLLSLVKWLSTLGIDPFYVEYECTIAIAFEIAIASRLYK